MCFLSSLPPWMPPYDYVHTSVYIYIEVYYDTVTGTYEHCMYILYQSLDRYSQLSELVLLLNNFLFCYREKLKAT